MPRYRSARTSTVSLALAFALAGCARPPASLEGTYAEISVTEAQRGGHTGQRVRWGGTIVSVTPEKDETCFEILDHPLDRETRPRHTDESSGRFIACAAGFYDPAVYTNGREVTVVGTLEEPQVRKIGEHEYRYARVVAEKVHLWPKRERYPAYYAPWPDPFWYPAWGPWPYGPWYYRSPYWGPWPYRP